MATKFMGGALGHTYLKSISRGGLGALIIGISLQKLQQELGMQYIIQAI